MVAIKCDCCGAPINPATYRCEYCGTQYMRPKEGTSISINGRLILPVYRASPVEIYEIKEAVTIDTLDMMRMNGIPVEDSIRKAFAEKIAKAIAKKLVITEDFDLGRATNTYSALYGELKLHYKKIRFNF